MLALPAGVEASAGASCIVSSPPWPRTATVGSEPACSCSGTVSRALLGTGLTVEGEGCVLLAEESNGGVCRVMCGRLASVDLFVGSVGSMPLQFLEIGFHVE